MKSIILALVFAVASIPQTPPTPKPEPQLPSITLDNNCMSYWRDITDENDKVIGREWIEPNWHELSFAAQRRCQLLI